jgi:hypothetical protein
MVLKTTDKTHNILISSFQRYVNNTSLNLKYVLETVLGQDCFPKRNRGHVIQLLHGHGY